MALFSKGKRTATAYKGARRTICNGGLFNKTGFYVLRKKK